jgi:hypothetical protein
VTDNDLQLCVQETSVSLLRYNFFSRSTLLHNQINMEKQRLPRRIMSNLLCLILKFQPWFYKIYILNYHNAILYLAPQQSHTDISVHIHKKVTNLYNGSSSIQLSRTWRNLAPVSSIQLFPCNFQYSLHGL